MNRVYAPYDLAISPTSYDFVVFLAICEAVRKLAGLDLIHVIFIPAPTRTGFKEDHRPSEDKPWRLDNLLIPACRLIGATHEVLANRRQFKADGEFLWPPHYTITKPRNWYMMHHLKDMGATKLSTWHPLPDAKALAAKFMGDKPYVTITLRNSGTAPGRNSDNQIWLQVRAWLIDQGYRVLVIPETYAAIEAPAIAALAAFNVILRHALYAGAAMNLGVSNGPMALCWATGLPFLMFRMVDESWISTKAAFLAKYGLPVGSQLPWSKGLHQRIIWENESLENVTRAFGEAMKVQDAA